MFLEDSFIYFPAKYPEGNWEIPDGPVSEGEFKPDIEDCFFLTEDQVKLHGWFCTPHQMKGNSLEPVATDAVLLWFHGNAGNIAYRYDMISMLMGIRGEPDGLRIDPQLPKAWKRARAWRAWRGAEFDIEIVRRPGTKRTQVELDGEVLSEHLIPPQPKGSKHLVRVALATSDNLQGIVAQGRTITETLEIARDIAKKLIEARDLENTIFPAFEDSFDYLLVV